MSLNILLIVEAHFFNLISNFDKLNSKKEFGIKPVIKQSRFNPVRQAV